MKLSEAELTKLLNEGISRYGSDDLALIIHFLSEIIHKENESDETVILSKLEEKMEHVRNVRSSYEL